MTTSQQDLRMTENKMKPNPLPRLADLLIKEADFQRTVIELAKRFGWRIHHTRPARTKDGWVTPIQGNAGFPDIVLSRGADILFIELKSETGKLSLEQKEWLDALDKNPTVRCFIWRPSQFDEIVELLK